MQDAKKRLKQEHLTCVHAALCRCSMSVGPHTPRLICVHRYLEQQAFVEQLQGLFNAVFACIDSTDTDKAAEKALRRQGFQCASQVYIAAYDHLQVARSYSCWTYSAPPCLDVHI